MQGVQSVPAKRCPARGGEIGGHATGCLVMLHWTVDDDHHDEDSEYDDDGHD